MTSINPRRLLAYLAIVAITLLVIVSPVARSETPTIESATQRIDPDCVRLGRCLTNGRTVFASLDVERLTSNLDDPNTYTVSGWFSLNWLPTAYPGWKPSDLSLGCASSTCNFSGWRDSLTENFRDRRIWTAHFELEATEAQSFFAYPFDQHWLKILIQASNPEGAKLIDYIDINSFSVSLALSLIKGRNSNFNVNYATVGQQSKFYHRTINPGDNTPEANAGDQPGPAARTTAPVESDLLFPVAEDELISTSVSFHLVRRTPAALLMIIMPMIIIIFNTILAFHWRENSPASRFGSSGLLTTVSLFFASRVFRPDVDHLVFSDIWFLVVFLVITANNVILAWLFRYYKHRAEMKRTGATTTIKPAWQTENRISLISGATVLGMVLVLLLISLVMLRPPAIPNAFMAGNSSYDDVGASVVKVIEANELLPSRYLITMPPGQPHRE